MAPSEQTILSAFLLPPAPLPALITLENFTALFPRAQQTSPQIRALYRDLQHQRLNAADVVTENIIQEVKRGNAQRRAVVRSRRNTKKELQDDEVDLEVALFGATSNLPVTRPHTLVSILPDMENAVEDIEDEIRRIDGEAEALLKEMRGTVGSLSDLRYGRLANGKLRDQVLEGLQRLENSCNDK